MPHSGPDIPQLTPPELDIMQALWSGRRLSAREIHDRVGPGHGWAYSTTRTTVERMVRKGLVAKDRVHGLLVYLPAISRATGLARLVRDFARQVLGSKPAEVLAMIDGGDSLSEKDLAELRSLLDHEEEAP